MALTDEFRAHLASLALPSGPALVAVSGGLDSVVLLDLLHRTIDDGRRLIVAHADHGIHPHSAGVASGVAAFAAGHRLYSDVGRLGHAAGTGERSAMTERER